ncbi:MAG: ATP-grasp domain-containing protein [Pseudonocardiaceae bacterium]|nr:ATP-grasp domain-containing protein [Pseudonocardiaceae bacterium]
MIRKLLVANRGEIASRVIRTARECDIATVAMFSDPDADAPFVTEADEAVALPGAGPADTYLRADLLVAAALATGADAVHPGYGFLAENAGFARACAEAGLVFVGPPAAAIESMGSKITAKELMSRAGVPVLPGVTVEPSDDLAAAAASVGFPLLVKASFGGGGRGMRIVRAPDELAEAVAAARREAASAFGDGTVFLERYLTDPRHVEVQIFGDTHGTVVHLHERECSIQRRYQKIIEEAPSPAVDGSLRAELGAAAVAAGKAIGYVGAGTVEFVLDEASGSFFFLEVNTRLQVEHPVTELVTGLDLVALQLRLADGQPLPEQATTATINGHAVEARLYAEDVAAGFLPASGTLARFSIPGIPGVRVDAGVMDGSVVSPHYDPMLAKVIAHGATRDEACRRLARALAEAQLHGVTTNRDLLVGVLREPGFRAGHTDTGYLTRHDPVALGAPPAGSAVVGLHAVAAALADQAARRAHAPVLATLPSGWRNVPSEHQHAVFAHGDEHIEVRYALVSGDASHGSHRHSRAVRAEIDGVALDGVAARQLTPERVDLDVAGVRRSIRVHRVDEVAYVDSALGATTLVELPRFPEPGTSTPPGSLLAPMPGTVVRVAVSAGEHVAAGAAVVVLEAMKMEHTVSAPHDGVVSEVNTEVGRTVDTGTVLAVVDEEEGE